MRFCCLRILKMIVWCLLAMLAYTWLFDTFVYTYKYATRPIGFFFGLFFTGLALIALCGIIHYTLWKKTSWKVAFLIDLIIIVSLVLPVFMHRGIWFD